MISFNMLDKGQVYKTRCASCGGSLIYEIESLDARFVNVTYKAGCLHYSKGSRSRLRYESSFQVEYSIPLTITLR